MSYARYSNLNLNSDHHGIEPRKKRWNPFKLVLLVFVLAAAFGLVLAIDSRVKAADRAQELAMQARYQKNIQNFSKQVNSIIKNNADIMFSVSTIDLSTGQSKNFGNDTAMEAASTAKLITAAAFLHDVQLGNESLTEQLGGYSARYNLEQMINQSDDTAWANLNDELGNEQIQSYANGIGLSVYDVYSNQISSSDIAKLLAKLYSGRLLNSANTKLLLGYMQHTNYEDFITPAVPSGDKIYHKVGELDDYVHDAAIITNGRQSFVLVIFTNGNGTYDWTNRAALMQKITKAAIQAYLN